MSIEHLRGVEWWNGVGRAARDACKVVNMQKLEVVVEVRELL